MKSNFQNQKSSPLGRASNQGTSWFRKSFSRIAVIVVVAFFLIIQKIDAQTAYIPNENSGGLNVINVGTNTITATIPGISGRGVAVSPDGSKVYISSTNGRVFVINTATNTMITSIIVSTNGQTGALCVSPDGTKVYVSGWTEISIINTATTTVSAVIPVNASGIAVSPDGSKIYVTNGDNSNGTLNVIETATNTISASIPVGASPTAVIVIPDGTMVYVATNYVVNHNYYNQLGEVDVINTATNTVTDSIAFNIGYPEGIVVSPDGSKVYVANLISPSNSTDGNVIVINTSTNTVSATITVGYRPWGISVSPDGSEVYVANFNSNTTSVINTATNTVVATIPAGGVCSGNFISTNITPPCAQTVNIPDNNFYNYIINTLGFISIGPNEICAAAAAAFTGTIDVNSLGISDMTGIEAFTAVTGLKCALNTLSSLNVSQNTALTYLECYYNNTISSLDLSHNTSLTYLDCGINSLSSLDVSQNTALAYLACQYNSLSSLDVSNNTALTTLVCNNNNLNFLNVANGNNQNMNSNNFYAYGNSNLSCIQVDDTAYSNANWSGNIDAQSYFSLNCAQALCANPPVPVITAIGD